MVGVIDARLDDQLASLQERQASHKNIEVN
jgi:hypothetical protein